MTTAASPSGQTPVQVNATNFVRAESGTYFDALAAGASGVNRWHHFREPTPIEDQTVIRMNRDTLYSSILVDISAGATLTMPDAKGRYQIRPVASSAPSATAGAPARLRAVRLVMCAGESKRHFSLRHASQRDEPGT